MSHAIDNSESGDSSDQWRERIRRATAREDLLNGEEMSWPELLPTLGPRAASARDFSR